MVLPDCEYIYIWIIDAWSFPDRQYRVWCRNTRKEKLAFNCNIIYRSFYWPGTSWTIRVFSFPDHHTQLVHEREFSCRWVFRTQSSLLILDYLNYYYLGKIYKHVGQAQSVRVTFHSASITNNINNKIYQNLIDNMESHNQLMNLCLFGCTMILWWNFIGVEDAFKFIGW